MTRLQAEGETNSGSEYGPTAHLLARLVARLLIAAPQVALLAFSCLIFLSWTGWGPEPDPAALLDDAPWVGLAGFTGAGAGALLVWAIVGRRALAIAIGAALGAIPAAVMVTAYFTNTY